MIRYGTQVISVVTVPQKSSTSTQPFVCSSVSQARKKTRYDRNSFSAKALSGLDENHLLCDPAVSVVAFIPLAPFGFDKLVMRRLQQPYACPVASAYLIYINYCTFIVRNSPPHLEWVINTHGR